MLAKFAMSIGHASIPQNSFVSDRRQEMYIYIKCGCSSNVGNIVYSVVVSYDAVDFGKDLEFQMLFSFLRVLQYQRPQTKTTCSLVSRKQYN